MNQEETTLIIKLLTLNILALTAIIIQNILQEETQPQKPKSPK